jgi:hypothetical protein
MDDRDAKALEHIVDKLKDMVDAPDFNMQAAKQPAMLLPVVFGLTQAVDQLYLHFRALTRQIEEWDREWDEDGDDDM